MTEISQSGILTPMLSSRFKISFKSASLTPEQCKLLACQVISVDLPAAKPLYENELRHTNLPPLRLQDITLLLPEESVIILFESAIILDLEKAINNLFSTDFLFSTEFLDGDDCLLKFNVVRLLAKSCKLSRLDYASSDSVKFVITAKPASLMSLGLVTNNSIYLNKTSQEILEAA